MPALGLCQSWLGGHDHPTRSFDTGDHGPPTTQVAMIVSFYKISLRFRLALLESGGSFALLSEESLALEGKLSELAMLQLPTSLEHTHRHNLGLPHTA